MALRVCRSLGKWQSHGECKDVGPQPVGDARPLGPLETSVNGQGWRERLRKDRRGLPWEGR